MFCNIIVFITVVSYHTVHYKVKESMTDLPNDTHLDVTDPKAPLVATDFAKLLMKHCSTVTKDSIMFERERTEDKINLVIEAMTKQIANVIVSKDRDNLANREKIKELELKLDTITKYQEQVLYNHRLETSREIRDKLNHTVYISSNSPGNIYGKTLQTTCNISEHLTNHSTTESANEHTLGTRNESCFPHLQTLDQLSLCTICGYTYNSQWDLQLHMYNYHGSYNHQYQLPYLANHTETVSRQSENQNLCLNEAEPPSSFDGEGHILYPCDACDLVFTRQDLYNNHRNYNHCSFPSNQELHCNKCELVFSDIVVLNTHLKTYHTNDPRTDFPIGCSTCGLPFKSSDALTDHIRNTHGPRLSLQSHSQDSHHRSDSSLSCLDLTCTACEEAFLSLEEADLHRRNHCVGTNSTCNTCNEVFTNRVNLDLHLQAIHGLAINSDDEHTIRHEGEYSGSERFPQLDGNVTMDESCDSVTEIDVYENDPEFRNAGYSVMMDSNALTSSPDSLRGPNPPVRPNNDHPSTAGASHDIQYKYTLNPNKQSTRLLENSTRPAFDTKYKSYQNINGKRLPTSVTIDCNSGVYLSTVKPALENITEGWEITVCNTLITCEEVSDRNDLSGRRVCTKLTMFLSENSHEKAKVVLHFYHTSTSLHLQGSHMMTSGVSSPVWLANNFLQPLASAQVSENISMVNSINDQIQQYSSSTCNSCKTLITPTANNPRDQGLTCNRCNKIYHKKCTDRRKTTTNWRKSPWYCSCCMIGNHDPQSDQLNTEVDPCIVTEYPPATSLVPALASVTVCSSLPVITPSIITPSSAAYSSSRPSITTNTSYPTPPAPAPAVSFPNNSVRQRSSNVNANSSEIDFLQTSLDTCRSTIAQQESELKKLKEAVEIRNKRIMQLEGQVGHAAEQVAARTDNSCHINASNDTSTIGNIDKSVTEILRKLDSLSSTTSASAPVNHFNIHNNSICHKCRPPKDKTEEHEAQDITIDSISEQSDVASTPPHPCKIAQKFSSQNNH